MSPGLTALYFRIGATDRMGSGAGTSRDAVA